MDLFQSLKDESFEETAGTSNKEPQLPILKSEKEENQETDEAAGSSNVFEKAFKKKLEKQHRKELEEEDREKML
jgi:hypothetical protein